MLFATVFAVTALQLSGVAAAADDGWLDSPLEPAAGGYTFRAADGTPMRWQRLAPAYVAWSLDQRDPGGPVAFAGVPATMKGLFETQDCESVGCHIYKLEGGGVQTLASQGSGYGIMDVGISRDGTEIAAISINTNPDIELQGRILSWRDGKLGVRSVRKQAFAIEDLDRGFAAIAGHTVYEGGVGGWQVWQPGPSCAFYDIAVNGNRVLLAGYSGTYLGRFGPNRTRPGSARGRRRHRGTRGRDPNRVRPDAVRRIGPASDAVWSSRDGETIAISPIAADAELTISGDRGKTWREQQLVDRVGAGACANIAGNDALDCNDNVPGARLDMHLIAGTGLDDLWAFGGRADIPGGRVYRYAGSDRWERIPFPADIWSASDAVVLEHGRPLVASMEGIFQAEPVG